MATVQTSEWRNAMRLGDIGPDVAAWRAILELDGLPSLSGPTNVFETSTHNATVAWQKARGLLSDGVVGPKTRASLDAAILPVVVHPFDPEAIPFVEARHWSRDVGPQHKALIVLHCMEYPESATTAPWCARFFASEAAPKASAHYCVDSDEVISCVPPDRIAWHAPGANKHGIGIEHAGYARQTRTQWLDDYSFAMLQLSARLTSWLCRRFEIPVQFVAAEQLRRGMAGITTHWEVTRAFPDLGSHTDPGPYFPINDYLAWVGQSLPKPLPKPQR